jgi:acyl-CoA thioesterase I
MPAPEPTPTPLPSDRPPRRAARRLPALLLSLALAACGGGDDATTSAPSAAPLDAAPGIWVVLGSSTAAGAGAAPGEGWVDGLAARLQPLGVHVVNLARPGLLSSQALPADVAQPAGTPPPDPTVNIDRALAQAPRLVLLAFPSNDAVAGVPAERTVAAWREMAARARAAGAATLVLSTQPRAGLTGVQQATLQATDEAAAAQFGACFVPLRQALAGADGAPAAAYAAGDGVHLNAAGHRVVLELVGAALAAGGCVRLPPGD